MGLKHVCWPGWEASPLCREQVISSGHLEVKSKPLAAESGQPRSLLLAAGLRF